MTEDTETKFDKKQEKLGSGKSRDRNKKEKAKPLTKVVIRRLPPTMIEEEFLKQIDPLPEFDFYYYVPADWSLGFDATCRAYINFKNQEDIFLFKDRFDGYVFVDTKGAEYPAIVEFAAFQGLPKNRSRKIDPKANTIEQDQHFISFLEKLTNDENDKQEPKLEFTLQTNKDAKITSTPLLQYLANKKQERRDDRKKRVEEKRRQRDDDRHKKKITIAQKIPQSIKEEDNKGSGINNIKDREKRRERPIENDRNDRNKDRKESRTKRREEKRKQERENRNRERERERERNRNSQDNKNPDVKPPIGPVAQVEDKKSLNQNRNKFSQKEDDQQQQQQQRKEVKKYSQSRRDKIRSRNESKIDGTTSTGSLKNEQNNLKMSNISKEEKSETFNKKDELNEVVRDFINTVSKIKEFVPRNRDNITEKDENKSLPNVNSDNFKELNKKLEKISLNESNWIKQMTEQNSSEASGTVEQNEAEKNNLVNNNSRRESRSSSSANEKNEKAIAFDKKEKEKETRRIRNKDRPSIAIYQPGKLRIGVLSAEPPKDGKSNPTSDCESIKQNDKDDRQQPIKKKVSRYSERRTNRVAGGKSKDEFVDGKYKQRRYSSDVGIVEEIKVIENMPESEIKRQTSLDIELAREISLKKDEEEKTLQENKDKVNEINDMEIKKTIDQDNVADCERKELNVENIEIEKPIEQENIKENLIESDTLTDEIIQKECEIAQNVTKEILEKTVEPHIQCDKLNEENDKPKSLVDEVKENDVHDETPKSLLNPEVVCEIATILNLEDPQISITVEEEIKKELIKTEIVDVEKIENE